MPVAFALPPSLPTMHALLAVGLAVLAIVILAFLWGHALRWRGRLQQALDTERERMVEIGNRATVAETRCEALTARISELGAVETECVQLRAERAQWLERIEQEQRRSSEQRALLEDAQAHLAESFKALSADALRANNQSFLELARENLSRFQQSAEQDLIARQKSIEQVAGPIREKLEKFEGHLGEIEKARVGAYESINMQVRELIATHLPRLHSETANLVKALRQPSARGRWGEVQLRRVVEMAGMLEHCDFNEQPSKQTDEGRLRPDVIVNLPGCRQIVIDAKAPVDAYLTAVEARDDAERDAALLQHARQVRGHVSQLGKKNYFEQFDPSPEFVVMFVPGEAFFSAALAQDPDLIEHGADLRVIPASPTTLIALLKAVHYGWRQEALAQNAMEVAALGKELFERLSTMGEHWARVGSQLDKAIEAYNKASRSLDARVMVSARRFVDLGAASSDTIESPPQIDRNTRPPI